MQVDAWGYAALFVLGLVFGSFFNVAIYRWPNEDPHEREWVRTPSHCPHCKHPIRWYDNVPLLSFVLLRGRCRHCHALISWRYPAVELGTALLWMLTAWLVSRFGLTGVEVSRLTAWHYVFAVYFASLYMLTVVIDLQTLEIPDEITIANFAGAWLFMLACRGNTVSPGWLSSVIGMLVLSGFFYLLTLLARRQGGAMGLGDALLSIGLGALFGWKLVIAVGFVAVLLGGAVAIPILAWLLLTRRYRGLGAHPIPFGPFLALSAYACMFWGWDLVGWYIRTFHLQAVSALHSAVH